MSEIITIRPWAQCIINCAIREESPPRQRSNKYGFSFDGPNLLNHCGHVRTHGFGRSDFLVIVSELNGDESSASLGYFVSDCSQADVEEAVSDE